MPQTSEIPVSLHVLDMSKGRQPPDLLHLFLLGTVIAQSDLPPVRLQFKSVFINHEILVEFPFMSYPYLVLSGVNVQKILNQKLSQRNSVKNYF